MARSSTTFKKGHEGFSGPTNGYFKHGKTRSVEWCIWTKMQQRCRNSRSSDWKNYGGRGICVCARWDNFETFAADMGPHPGKGWSLDRIDNDGNYELSNCRWATRATQNRNQRRTILSAHIAEEIRARYIPRIVSQRVLAKEYGVSHTEIGLIVRGKHWRPEQAVA